MPVLHKYKSKDDYYILTSIKGKIITYQLTPEGTKKLIESGVEPDRTFGRALLLDLVRSDQAYTQGKGPSEIDPGYQPDQLPLDLVDDSDPETLFPSCSKCSSFYDLHLVEIKGIGTQSKILCPKCRGEKAGLIDASIPIYLVSRGILSRLLEREKIDNVDESVRKYQELLDAEFEKKWETLIKAKNRKVSQTPLFKKDHKKQATLF